MNVNILRFCSLKEQTFGCSLQKHHIIPNPEIIEYLKSSKYQDN